MLVAALALHSEDEPGDVIRLGLAVFGVDGCQNESRSWHAGN